MYTVTSYDQHMNDLGTSQPIPSWEVAEAKAREAVTQEGVYRARIHAHDPKRGDSDGEKQLLAEMSPSGNFDSSRKTGHDTTLPTPETPERWT